MRLAKAKACSSPSSGGGRGVELATSSLGGAVSANLECEDGQEVADRLSYYGFGPQKVHDFIEAVVNE
jgi:hypothetical protein